MLYLLHPIICVYVWLTARKGMQSAIDSGSSKIFYISAMKNRKISEIDIVFKHFEFIVIFLFDI